MPGPDEPVTRRHGDAIDVWLRGWKVRFHANGSSPEVSREPPPVTSVHLPEVRVAARYAERIDVRVGDWIARVSKDPDLPPAIRTALPQPGRGFGALRGQ